MESNKLAVIDRSIPIRSIPEAELNRIILTDFMDWVSGILSLTDETSANRLEIALPAIKKHCWSMGFAEIKKMFEMYVDNKLSVKPIPNYFDRILFGKIVEAYRQQKPKPKPPEQEPMSQEEKDMIVYSGILNCFEAYKQDGYVKSGYGYVYDELFEKGQLPKHTKEFKERIKNKAVQELEKEITSLGITTQVKEQLEALKTQNRGIKGKCKQLILEEYFQKLVKLKIHIKTVLK